MEESRRYRIGYALAPKKNNSFIQPSLVNLSRDRGIDLVPIDPSFSLLKQGPFDCVLHKLYGEDWKAQLHEFAVKNPNVPIIDRPNAIERLHNRISMLQVVSELEIPQDRDTFGIPSQVVVYDSLALSDSRAVDALRFPVIAKPLVADGSAKSHKMSLVYNRAGLLKLKPPLVLQEFVNHGGVIFKVYVVGDYVKCVRRKSLPDVSEEKLESTEGSMTFSQVSNISTQDRKEEKYYEHLEEAEMPPLSFVTEIARLQPSAMASHHHGQRHVPLLATTHQSSRSTCTRSTSPYSTLFTFPCTSPNRALPSMCLSSLTLTSTNATRQSPTPISSSYPFLATPTPSVAEPSSFISTAAATCKALFPLQFLAELPLYPVISMAEHHRNT